jgi:hypothetical protein
VLELVQNNRRSGSCGGQTADSLSIAPTAQQRQFRI